MLPVLGEILKDRPVAAYMVNGRGALVDLCGAFPGTYALASGAVVGGIMPGCAAAWSLNAALSNRARSTANVPSSLTGNAEFSIEMFLVPRAFAALTLNGWGLTSNVLGAAGLWCTAAGRLTCEYAGGNSAAGSVATTMVLGRINHVVYTKRPGAIAANSKFYVNGVDTGALTGSANTPNIGASPFTVGQWADYNLAGGESTSAIHQLTAFYPRALDLPSVVRHLRAMGGRPNYRRGMRAA